jgi:hypothetical protein
MTFSPLPSSSCDRHRTTCTHSARSHVGQPCRDGPQGAELNGYIAASVTGRFGCFSIARLVISEPEEVR